MEAVLPFVIVSAGLAFTGGMGLVSWWRTTRRTFIDAWRGVDSDLDVVDAGFEIVLRSRQAPHLRLAAEQRRHGKHRWTITAENLRFGAATWMSLALSGYTRAARDAVVGSDIQVGDAAFDDRFDIKGGNADVIRAVFAHDEVRAAARALFEGFEVKGFSFNSTGTLHVEVQRYGLDVERTRALHAALHRFVALIEQHTPTTTAQLGTGSGERVPSSINAGSGVPVGIKPY